MQLAFDVVTVNTLRDGDTFTYNGVEATVCPPRPERRPDPNNSGKYFTYPQPAIRPCTDYSRRDIHVAYETKNGVVQTWWCLPDAASVVKL